MVGHAVRRARPAGAAASLIASLALLFLTLLTASTGALAQADAKPSGPASAAAPSDRESPRVVALSLDGVVGPATSDYLVRAIRQANDEKAAAIVLRIDTPGGLDTSMREIIRAILASRVPVLSHVAPGGARAASAGTYILYASHVAAMAPGTNLGAATPVAIGGMPKAPARPEAETDPNAGAQPKSAASGAASNPASSSGPASGAAGNGARRAPASPSEAKAVNDAVAYIRSLAELRGRNADWAERAVREAESLSATAALQAKVIDLIASSTAELLEKADGRTVLVAGERTVLRTRGAAVVPVEPDWRTRLLGAIGHPNIALILMMIGIYGLMFEFMSPGSLYPGTIGAISLLLGLYALAALPLTLAGIALAVLGLALLVAEAFIPSFGVLGIGGILAFAFAAMVLFDTEGVPGFELYWPLIGAVLIAGVGLMLLVARLAVRSRRRDVRTGRQDMLGARAEVIDWAGSKGHVEMRGERWNAVATEALAPGEPVVVTAIDGLTLAVERRPEFFPRTGTVS